MSAAGSPRATGGAVTAAEAMNLPSWVAERKRAASPHIAADHLCILVAELRRARRALRVSQRALAGGLGVKELSVSSWERGVDTPAAGNFLSWADALGYTLRVEGFSLNAVVVRHKGEPFEEFQLRRLMASLADAREAAGLTQEQVSDALGVSSWTVHMWETTNRVPRLLRLIAWCHVLGCRLALAPRLMAPAERRRDP